MPRITSLQLQEQIAELLDEAQAINALAEKEDRDLTSDEQERFDEIMDEESGELATLNASLESVAKIENEKKRLAEMRAAVRLPATTTIETAEGKPQDRLPRVIYPNLRAFKGENALRAAWQCGNWLRAVASRGQDERSMEIVRAAGFEIRNVATEGTETAGGYIVPDPLSTAIIDVRQLVGLTDRIVRTIPMTADTLSVPKRTGGLTVQYPGESAAITLSDKTWGQVNLTAVKRATLSKISNELRDDAIINVVDDLASEIGHALALQMDNELCNGDGTATYGGEIGLRTALGSAGTFQADTGDSTWATLDLDDFHAVTAGLPEQYHPMAVWVMSRAFFHTAVEALAAAAGGINTVDLAQGANRRIFLGYPIEFSDQMPTATAVSQICALFGDFRQSVIKGERAGMEISISEHYAFDEDVITVRGVSRYDLNVHEPGDGTDAGGYVGLQTAAS